MQECRHLVQGPSNRSGPSCDTIDNNQFTQRTKGRTAERLRRHEHLPSLERTLRTPAHIQSYA
eukprot:3499126-Amphidinium_carterae.1